VEDAVSELSADAKQLIERARLEDAPRVEDRQRIRERLAVQLGAGAFAGAALLGAGSALEAAHGAGKGSFLHSALLRWVAGTLAAGGLALGGLLLATSHERRSGAPATVAPPTHVEPAPVEPTPASVEPAPGKPAAPRVEPAPVAPTARRSARRHARKPSAPSFAPVGNSGSLSAEIALLAQAQKALRARDGHEALRLARQHAANFPSGALYEERVGIEAIAHCVLGEREHPAVRAFLARSPRSPLSARVRKECGVP
jgi:hypothetical protein